MTSEQRDPMEAVQMRAWRRAMKVHGFAMNEANMEAVRDLAGRAYNEALNAADPIRAILPEVVEALEVLEQLVSERDGAMLSDILHVQLLLTKLRTFHTTTGGTDDGE